MAASAEHSDRHLLCHCLGRDCLLDFLTTDPGVPGSIPGHYKEVVGLERGPLSLVSTTEELLGRKSSDSCLENREYGRGDRCADHATTLILCWCISLAD
jgi:hypothetical protein